MTSKKQKNEEDSHQTIWEGEDAKLSKLIQELLHENGIATLDTTETEEQEDGASESLIRIQVRTYEQEEAALLVESYLAQLSNEAADQTLKEKVPAPTKITPLNESTLEFKRIRPLSLGVFSSVQVLLLFLTIPKMQIFSGTKSGIFVAGVFTYGVIASLIGGFCLGILSAWLYNLIAFLVGGIRITTLDSSKLLSPDFRTEDCFYTDVRGRFPVIIGPVTRGNLDELIAEGEVEPTSIVQIGQHTYRAYRLPVVQ